MKEKTTDAVSWSDVNKDVSWNFSRILARTIITKIPNTMHAEVDVFNVPN